MTAAAACKRILAATRTLARALPTPASLSMLRSAQATQSMSATRLASGSLLANPASRRLSAWAGCQRPLSCDPGAGQAHGTRSLRVMAAAASGGGGGGGGRRLQSAAAAAGAEAAPAAPAARSNGGGGAAPSVTHFQQLVIRDFALVEEQRVRLAPGLTVITGGLRPAWRPAGHRECATWAGSGCAAVLGRAAPAVRLQAAAAARRPVACDLARPPHRACSASQASRAPASRCWWRRWASCWALPRTTRRCARPPQPPAWRPSWRWPPPTRRRCVSCCWSWASLRRRLASWTASSCGAS